MAKTMGVRELKAHASEIVKEAIDGKPTVVTLRGTPVAIVLPFSIDVGDLATDRSRRFAESYRRAINEEGLQDGEDVLEQLSRKLEDQRSSKGAGRHRAVSVRPGIDTGVLEQLQGVFEEQHAPRPASRR